MFQFTYNKKQRKQIQKLSQRSVVKILTHDP